jgi:hypothetical protein
MQVWNKYFVFILAVVSLQACRLRRDDSATSSADSTANMKLFATCVSETPVVAFRNIIVQNDIATLKGLLLMDNGETGTESQTIKPVSLVIESQNGAEVRRTFTSGEMILTIELKQSVNDTFTARFKQSASIPDVTYNCAI